MPRAEIRVWGLDMSVKPAASCGVLARRRFWLVDRVWLGTGTLSWDSIVDLSWAIVSGRVELSSVTRSNPSLLRTLIIILVIT